MPKNLKKTLENIRSKADDFKELDNPTKPIRPMQQKPIKEILYDMGKQLESIKSFYENVIFTLLNELEKQKKPDNLKDKIK